MRTSSNVKTFSCGSSSSSEDSTDRGDPFSLFLKVSWDIRNCIKKKREENKLTFLTKSLLRSIKKSNGIFAYRKSSYYA